MPITWQRTFPDSHFDFSASENGERIGRIYRNSAGQDKGTWVWSCTGCKRGIEAEGVRPLHGTEAARQDAIAALLAAWERAKAWRERTGLPVR